MQSVKTDPSMIKSNARTQQSRIKVDSPSPQYLKLSQQESVECNEVEPKKQLIILDLNGTMVSRTGKRGGYRGMYVRPYHDEFLDYLFQHFTVMVWSSAQPHSVDNMCRLFGDHRPQLYKVWDRSHLGLTHAEYHRKSVTIKDLSFIWRDAAVSDSFDATNTILLDDSPAKAVLQPYNAIHLATFDHKLPAFREHGERELLSVIRYLDMVRRQSNVCSYIRQHPYKSPSVLEDRDKENKTLVYHYSFAAESKPERALREFKTDAASDKSAAAAAAAAQQDESLVEKLGSLRL